LLAKGANLNAKDKDGGTALMSATWGGHVDIVKILLKKKQIQMLPPYRPLVL
jgi:uncharacterized protein